MTSQMTVHASAVLVGDRAVLIRGPSGSGKSRLAFDLILAGRAGQIPAATLVGDEVSPSFAALEFPGIEQARYDARWVARFVSAYANADTPTGQALFGAAMADGQLSECLVTLAGSTVATLRRRESTL